MPDSFVNVPAVFLKFPLQVVEGWPPVAVESLPFEKTVDGLRVLVPPLFIKDLSVGDIISAQKGEEDLVELWRHVRRSNRTTIWLLRLRQTHQIEKVLSELRALGCDTVGLESAGCYSVDVPECVAIREIDASIAQLDSASCAVVFPSMRHPE